MTGHNDPRWFAVVRGTEVAEERLDRWSRSIRADGWYVIRRCPCHAGHAVTVCFDTRSGAERALRALNDDHSRYDGASAVMFASRR